MRRETIEFAVARIVNDLESAGLQSMFAQAVDGRHRGPQDGPNIEWVSFEAYHKYAVATADYGDVERSIMELMGIDRLLEPTFWQELARTAEPPLFYDYFQRIKFATHNLPVVLRLFRRDYDVLADTTPNEYPLQFRGKELLTILLFEQEHEFSSTQRIIVALEAVQGIYEVISEISNVRDELIVLGCDSGSDKSFDLLGIAEGVGNFKEVILGLYDRIFFFRQSAASKEIATVAEALPIFAQIAELEAQEKLDPEDSALLRNRLTSSLGKFVDSGAAIPEMEGRIAADPRIMMRPQPKLLAAPTDVGNIKGVTDDVSSDEPTAKEAALSDAEAAALVDRLRKSGYLSGSKSATRAAKKHDNKKSPRS